MPLRPRGQLWILAVSLFLGGLLGNPARGDESTTSTLSRPESPVVVPGRNLKALLKREIDTLRLYAWKEGKLVPIPFQIDERTPSGELAYEHGEERRSDTDDARLDDDDELVFMARDVGDRAPADAIRLGQSGLVELIVKDPRGRGWVYLLHFAHAPPPLAKGRYVSLDWSGDELLGWTAQRVQARVGPDGHFLDLRSLRFASASGGFGVDVLDRAKVHLRASYLFLDVHRRLDEIRSNWRSYHQGPVRVVAGVQAESYLTWGRWLSTTRRSRLVIYGNRLELHAQIEVPVDLEATKPSSLRASLDFAPVVEDLIVWSNRNPKPLRCTGEGQDPQLAKVHTSGAEWVACASSRGAILLRLRLDAPLQKRRHRLFLEDGPLPDPPEDTPGSRGNAGFELDLTGIPAGRYEFVLSAHFLPSLAPGGETPILAVEDAPLACEALSPPEPEPGK